MAITFNFFQPKSIFMKSQQHNKIGNLDRNVDNKSSRKGDSVSISPQGRMMNMVERLKEQKKSIIERKNEITAKNIESGGNVEDIKSQIDLYSKQISNIYSQQAKEIIASFEEKQQKPKENNDNETKDEVEVKRLTKIANLSESVKLNEIVSSCKDKADGDVRVLESEITLDELDVERLENKGLASTINVEDLIKNRQKDLDVKGDVLSDLEVDVLSVSMLESDNIANLSKEISENNKEDDSDTKTEDQLSIDKMQEKMDKRI